MGFIIGCAAYIVVCQIICKILDLKTFNQQAIVYAIVGCVGGFIIKATVKDSGDDESGEKPIIEVNQNSVRLEGIISNYPILMDLKFSGGNVSGSYYYKKKGSGERLYLSGSLNGNNLELNERNVDGMKTGFFEGTFKNGTYSGTFENYKGQRFKFHLSN